MNTSLKFFQNLKTSHSLFFISLLTLIIQGFILTNNLQEWRDIGLWDETMYLGNGISFFIKQPTPYWGPFYSLWYFILNLFTTDPINLYYLNYKVMVILLPVIISVYIFRLSDNVIMSFFYSYLLLISSINSITSPKISHFALVLIFIALIMITIVKSNDKKLLIASIAAMIITYVRPEFILAFLILLTILAVKTIKEKIKKSNIAIVISSAALLLFVLGNPYNSGRSLTAFGQSHIKYFNINDNTVENKKAKEWTEVLNDDFRNPKTLLDVIINNSRRFFNHLSHNIKSVPNIFNKYEELIFPAQFISINNPILLTLLLSIISAMPFLMILFANKNLNLSFIDSLTNLIFLIGISIIFILPPLLSIILFFPRPHYILLLIPLFYTFLVAILIPSQIKSTLLESSIFFLLIIISFLALQILIPGFGKYDLKNRKTIEDIRKLHLQKKVIMLENNGGFVYYLGSNYKWININSKNQTFERFILDKRINMIVDPSALNKSSKLKSDSTWHRFLSNPPSFGFREKVLDSGRSIFIKENL